MEELRSRLDDNLSKLTQSRTRSMNFVWKVKNFHKSLFVACGKTILSPEFNLSSFRKPIYHFELRACEEMANDVEKYLSIRLFKSKDKEIHKDMGYNCCVKYCSVPKADSFLTSRKKVIHPTKGVMVTKKNVFVFPHDLFPDGDFTLNFEIFYESDTRASKSATSNADLEDFSRELAQAYEENMHSDVTLISSGSKFKIHRAILDARFPEFSQLLKKDPGKIIPFSPRIEKEVTETLLPYLYCGKLNTTNLPIGFYNVISIYEPMRLKSLLFGEKTSICATTRFKEKKLTFTWKIPNFSKINLDETRSCFSFGVESLTWTWLKVLFKFEYHDSRTNIALSIQRYSEQCKAAVCNVKAADKTETFKHNFGSEHLWNIEPFISKEMLLANKSLYLPNDELSICFEVSVFDGTLTSDIDGTDYSPCLSQPTDDLKHLQKDMEKLLNETKFSDVTLIVGGDTQPAHKFVLAARSRVFRKVFEIQDAMDKKSEINIKDLDLPAVKSMLKFIYFADVECDIVDAKYALGLYVAANKYEIKGLKGLCGRYLKSSLSSENAIQVLLSADDCGDQDLTNHVIGFICLNSEAITSSEGWKSVKERKQLMINMLEKAFECISEKKK